jgi:endonuclease YncB( thermonuclease family)
VAERSRLGHRLAVRNGGWTALLALALVAAAPEPAGRVVAVADGDTLTLLRADRSQQRVRLAEIDTPERGQPYSRRSREALAALVAGKQVRLQPVTVDRYGRSVARIYVGDLDVNAALVRQGAAWVYREHAREPLLYELEREARAQRRGLWALPEAQRVPPWEWRKRATSPAPRLDLVPTSVTSACGTKTYCREMTSCAEARFHLEHCKRTRLDGDRDGVPCETLCR